MYVICVEGSRKERLALKSPTRSINTKIFREGEREKGSRNWRRPKRRGGKVGDVVGSCKKKKGGKLRVKVQKHDRQI